MAGRKKVKGKKVIKKAVKAAGKKKVKAKTKTTGKTKRAGASAGEKTVLTVSGVSAKLLGKIKKRAKTEKQTVAAFVRSHFEKTL